VSYEDDFDREMAFIGNLPVPKFGEDEDEFPFGAPGKLAMRASVDEVARMRAHAAAAEVFKQAALHTSEEQERRYQNDAFYHAVIHAMRQVWQLRSDAQVESDPVGHCIALADAILPAVQAQTLREFADFIGNPTDPAGLDRYTLGQVMMEARSRADRLEGKG